MLLVHLWNSFFVITVDHLLILNKRKAIATFSCYRFWSEYL